MDDGCCAPPPLNLSGNKKPDTAYRRALWAVLAINAAMFAVEVIAGLAAGSASLQADALDFLGMPPITPLACSWLAWHYAIAPVLLSRREQRSWQGWPFKVRSL